MALFQGSGSVVGSVIAGSAVCGLHVQPPINGGRWKVLRNEVLGNVSNILYVNGLACRLNLEKAAFACRNSVECT